MIIKDILTKNRLMRDSLSANTNKVITCCHLHRPYPLCVYNPHISLVFDTVCTIQRILTVSHTLMMNRSSGRSFHLKTYRTIQ